MLILENIRVGHGSFSLEIEQWLAHKYEFHSLLGCNGAGKSTLLKVIAGELAFNGSARLHGIEISGWDPSRRARHLAVLPQSSQLGFSFHAHEVVQLGATPLKLGWRELGHEVDRVMEFTQCAGLKQVPFPKLSGGEKQRVHLARVLLQLSQAEQEPLLLLDEPTSAQDLGQQHRMLQTMQELAEGKGYAVVAVLHDLNQALRYTHRCSLVDAGRLVSQGRPESVLTSHNVSAYWGYPAQVVHCPDGRATLV